MMLREVVAKGGNGRGTDDDGEMPPPPVGTPTNGSLKFHRRKRIVYQIL